MKRTPLPPRRTRLARKAPPPRSRKPIVTARPRPKKRTPSEFERIYGSRARVRWVKSLPCVYCAMLNPLLGLATAGRSHNAHTVTGGMGRKADADTICPLCPAHHRLYDEHAGPFTNDLARDVVKAAAAEVAARWRAIVGTAPP